MSELYKRAKAGRLTFKGGDLAATKSIDKKRKKKKHKIANPSEDRPSDAIGAVADDEVDGATIVEDADAAAAGEDVYTIDAARKMKYEELFPVEAKKFRYDPANKERTKARSVEQALDDRVKKKADRYCKSRDVYELTMRCSWANNVTMT